MGEMGKVVSNSVITKIDCWLLKFPSVKKQSAVLAALRFAQEDNGGLLSIEIMNEIANYLSMSNMAVYEVASFYSMYELKHKVKYKICVCTNVSCMLAGSDRLVEYIKKKLGVGFNEVTLDKKYYLREVECLASCDGAPVIQVGTKYYENVTLEEFDKILLSLK